MSTDPPTEPPTERLAEPEPQAPPPAAALWNGFAAALTLLTVIPARFAGTVAPRLTDAWFPLVGALVGALAGGVRAALGPVVGSGPASVVAIVTLVAVTGALHQDGLADSLDALGVKGEAAGLPARRLAVMREPSLGAFGVLGLVGWTLLAVSALATLGDGHAVRALVAAAAAARWAALLHAELAPPARADGLGARLAVSPAGLGAASLLALAAVLLAGLAAGVIVLALAAAVGALTALAALRLVGGRTGDTLGATVALTEAVALLALAGWWHP